VRTLVAALMTTLMLSACANPREIGGVTYDRYGLFNADEKKNPDIEYHIVVGNVVWSVILVETVIAPLYFIGFALYEPIGPKTTTVKGAIQ
jgi:hypothetical protein